MAATQPLSVSMELADFLAKVVLDAFDGICAGLRLQDERRAEMVQAATLDVSEFARLTLSDDEVNREAARLFPSADVRRPHAVYAGSPYLPPLKPGEPENPAFRDLLDVHLERADYTAQRGTKGFVLAEPGVQKVITALRDRLGAQSQSLLRSALNRGIPYVFVSSGEVKAKLSLTLEAAVPVPATATAAGTASVISRQDARLLVRMVDDRAPQNQQLRVDILSELHVSFKSIT